MSEYQKVVRTIMQAMAQRDYETFLDQLSDDIEYHFHVGTRPLIGKEWVRKFLARYEKDNSDVTWRIETFAETGNKLLVEGYEEYVGPDGALVKHPYMGIFEFKDGKICGWRDYFQM